ncbi:MAG: Interferon-induced transmembrane protein [candidate division BRC1 bacterium ADurb.BinA292]|nr:MAG: Interferon-induced transmembrane protein [candidate division BRC1 bacterium ADurb.BinA292]
MFCPQCGAENPEGSQRCSQCGAILPQRQPAPAGAAPVPGSLPNYLVQAILVTVCCCVPFGIVAIVYAAQVNSKLTAGDFAGATESSAKAKKWCWIALITGLIVNGLVVALQVAGILAGVGVEAAGGGM